MPITDTHGNSIVTPPNPAAFTFEIEYGPGELMEKLRNTNEIVRGNYKSIANHNAMSEGLSHAHNDALAALKNTKDRLSRELANVLHEEREYGKETKKGRYTDRPGKIQANIDDISRQQRKEAAKTWPGQIDMGPVNKSVLTKTLTQDDPIPPPKTVTPNGYDKRREATYELFAEQGRIQNAKRPKDEIHAAIDAELDRLKYEPSIGRHAKLGRVNEKTGIFEFVNLNRTIDWGERVRYSDANNQLQHETNVLGVLAWLCEDQLRTKLHELVDKQVRGPTMTQEEKAAALADIAERIKQSLREEVAYAWQLEATLKAPVQIRDMHPALLLGCKVKARHVVEWHA